MERIEQASAAGVTPSPRAGRAPHAGLDALGRRRTGRPAIVAIAVVAATLLLLAALARSGASQPATDTEGTPCPDATLAAGTPDPAATGTPGPTSAATPCASPAVDATPGPGTPVAAGDLTVTLATDNLAAGPRDLTVAVDDAAGRPVTEATVTIRTRTLEMDHGVSTDETVQIEPGRYLAEGVSLGMGGAWLVEVTIERPGADPVVLFFVLTLEGPGHGH